MYIRKTTLILLLFAGLSFAGKAQELNCVVSISTSKIQSSDKKIYETLQAAIYEFMNSRKWTSYTYSSEERIECTMLISIDDRSNDVFKGSITVQSRRPIYKSSYDAVMLNLIDKDLQFTYQEYQSLNYSDNSFTSNLTSVLAYYAYLIIGTDFDSYQLNGGTPYFEKAQTIITNAQNTSEPGWKAFESSGKRNRYWLIENLLNNIYSPIREANYNYHRKGLDMMVDAIATGKNSITSAIEKLKTAHEEKPGSYLMQLFFIAKCDEIVNIYSGATAIEKTKVTTICKMIDPTNSAKYNKINK